LVLMLVIATLVIAYNRFSILQYTTNASPKLKMSVSCDGCEVLSIPNWGVISVRGADRLRFLHSLGTNAFEGAPLGTVVYNCFLNGKGKLLDYTRGLVLRDDVKVLSSPSAKDALLALLHRSVFPIDRVELVDESQSWLLLLGVGGEDEASVLTGAGAGANPTKDHRVSAVPLALSRATNEQRADTCLVVEGNDLGATPEAADGTVGLSCLRGWTLLLLSHGRPSPHLPVRMRSIGALRGRPALLMSVAHRLR